MPSICSLRSVTLGLVILLAGRAVPAAAQSVPLPAASGTVPGYSTDVKGEVLTYHSPIPTVNTSLLVRSLDRGYDIEWESAAVPAAWTADSAVFVLMIGIDVNESPRRFDLFVNGDSVLSFENPVSAEPGTIAWPGTRGVRGSFRVTELDKYGDAMGYLFLTVPRAFWQASRRLRFRVAGESAGERTWFMVFREPIAPRLEARNAPALLRATDGATQSLRVDVLHLGAPAHLTLRTPVATLDTTVTLGLNRLEVAVPRAESPVTVPVAFDLAGTAGTLDAAVAPVRQLELYLIHHTHLDIGYTDRQDAVERLQWAHLDSALVYGAASSGFPDGDRFVWHPEGLWAVESYLAARPAADCARLLDGIRRGWIVLDGMFANLLTGLATDEVLQQALEPAHRIEALTGIPIETAMLSDIPGFSWGLVPALFNNGIRYLTIGPNFGHRIGSFTTVWGDRPFYWESPSGEERVLTWISGGGYAWFHSGLGYATISKRFDEENVFKYLTQLADADYPYDIAALRYNIGSDNGPPDPGLAEAVRAWNEKYLWPRIRIGSTPELFHAFESRYGNDLPVYRGDLTGYWEDGAASSARETAATRRTAESLTQTAILAAMLGHTLPEDVLDEAWRQVLLFEEHTWGSWNSISEPEAQFTLDQWARKKAMADSAAALAARLRATALGAPDDAQAAALAVYNTANWARTDVVTVPAAESAAGDVVLDDAGNAVPSQRLASGELAFVAERVPAFGARRYRVTAGAVAQGHASGEANVISTDRVRLTVDPATGTISSLVDPRSGQEFVAADGGGLDAPVYVSSRDPAERHGSTGVSVERIAWGPVVHTIRVRASLPGTRGVAAEISVYPATGRVEIVNRVDKELVYTPEALLYRFPFALDRPRARVSVPNGWYEAEREQLPGANRNYLTVERWVDLADDRGGVTVASVDAPLIQIGEIRTDAIVAGWADALPASGTLFSYAMNNYWETNYRAGQEGPHALRYALRLHEGFDAAQADRWGREVAQPLVVSAVPDDAPPPALPFGVTADRAVVTAVEPTPEGDALLVRVYNPADALDTVTVTGYEPFALAPRASAAYLVWATPAGGR